jgi:hypothetical protein
MTKDDAHKAARAMSNGRYGSFAFHIGTAYLIGDKENKQSLLEAFQSLFQHVYHDIWMGEQA